MSKINNKAIHGLDLFKIQNVLESTSPLREVIQLSSIMMSQTPSVYSNEIIAESIRPIREVIGKVHQTYKPICVSYLKMMGAVSQLLETLRVSANVVNADTLQGMIKSITIRDSTIRTLGGINWGLDSACIKAISNLNMNTKAIEQAMRQNLEIFRDIDFSSLIEGAEITGLTFDDFDLESALDDAVIDLNSNISLQQKILNILESFKKANPIIFILIYFFIFSPLQAAYNDAVFSLITSNTKTIANQVDILEAKTIEKNIKIEVNNILNVNFDSNEVKQQVLNQYRYVSTNSLVVRKDKSVGSKAIYTLEFGQVVRLVYKNKNWSLIEYVDEDDNIIKGWVFTRYISKFKK